MSYYPKVDTTDCSKMDPKVKALWCVTLESGNYKQGVGRLRNDKNECCCLGVLCDIVDPEGWKIVKGIGPKHHGTQGSPVLPLLNKVGLHPGVADKLARMNDALMPFKEIAAWIRSHL